MTPREKAEELVNMFYGVNTFSKISTAPYISRDFAKKCALIAVEEFLSFQENLYITEGSLAYQYWQEVKNEIEKL